MNAGRVDQCRQAEKACLRSNYYRRLTLARACMVGRQSAPIKVDLIIADKMLDSFKAERYCARLLSHASNDQHSPFCHVAKWTPLKAPSPN